jgi:NADPH:quinone reductase-like Zn-dependent oxidoreductase
VKAAVLAGSAPTPGLEWSEVPKPQPRAGEVLIEVHAAGVNPGDGWFRFESWTRSPLIPGLEVAGVVAGLGPEAGRFALGEPVLALLEPRRCGGYAEYVCAEEAATASLGGLPFEVGAALPRAGLAALQALRDRAVLERDDEVLINGASGGVGHFAIQLAVSDGARVSAVAGPGRRRFLRALGAEEVFDYTESDFTEGEREYDVVFDVAASRRVQDCEMVLRDDGVYVTTARTASFALAAFRAGMDRRLGRQRPAVRGLRLRSSSDDLAELVGRVKDGVLHPLIHRVDSLEGLMSSVPASGRVAGKLVLAIPQAP